MPNIGVDVGTENTHVAIVEDGKVLGLGSRSTGFDQVAAVEESIRSALEKAGMDRRSINRIIATGLGKKGIPSITTHEANEPAAAAKGATMVIPSARTVIDAGSEETRCVKVDKGRVMEFALNDKCAAGAGSFAVTMAKALELKLEEFIAKALESAKEIPMNAQCVIFAESEVISLMHAGYSAADISGAVHRAMAERTAVVVKQVGVEEDVVLVGGLARNVAFFEALKKALKVNIVMPENPGYISAIGAASSG